MAEVEGVVVNLKNVQGHYRLVFADGSEFGLPPNRLGMPNTAAASEVMKLYGRRVRFPVNAYGNVAARPKQVLASTVEGEATSFACFSCREPGVLHRVECHEHGTLIRPVKRLLCASCRQAEEKECRELDVVTSRRQAEDGQLPWERHDAKPLEQASRPTDDTSAAEERLPWDEPQQAPATKRDLERIERKLDELPVSVAIAVGGHPADEAERATAEAAERPA